MEKNSLQQQGKRQEAESWNGSTGFHEQGPSTFKTNFINRIDLTNEDTPVFGYRFAPEPPPKPKDLFKRKYGRSLLVVEN